MKPETVDALLALLAAWSLMFVLSAFVMFFILRAFDNFLGRYDR